MRLNMFHRDRTNIQDCCSIQFYSLLCMHIPTWLKYNVEARHACLCALSIHAGKIVAEKDAVVFLSNSGNTPECVTAARILLSRGVHIFAITGGQGVCAMCTNTHTMLINRLIVYEYARLFKYVSTCVCFLYVTVQLYVLFHSSW